MQQASKSQSERVSNLGRNNRLNLFLQSHYKTGYLSLSLSSSSPSLSFFLPRSLDAQVSTHKQVCK